MNEPEVCPRCGSRTYWGKFLELMVCEGADCPWFRTPEGDEYYRTTLEERDKQ